MKKFVKRQCNPIILVCFCSFISLLFVLSKLNLFDGTGRLRLQENILQVSTEGLGSEGPSLRILVLTMNRKASLERLLKSLDNSFYQENRVDLDIWVDVHHASNIDPDTSSLSENFVWRHGIKKVHYQDKNAGLRGQWLYTWGKSVPGGLRPGLKEKCLILEDDLEVSPYFFLWLMEAHKNYSSRAEINGFTLQRAQLCAKNGCSTLNGGPHKFEKGNFGYHLVGSWGFSPILDHWIKFLKWVEKLDESTNKPYIAGLTPTSWYKNEERKGKCPGNSCIWTILHIKYCETHYDRFTVYAKTSERFTLASNWRERGLHFGAKSKVDFPFLNQRDNAIFEFSENLKLADYGANIINNLSVDHTSTLLKRFKVVMANFCDTSCDLHTTVERSNVLLICRTMSCYTNTMNSKKFSRKIKLVFDTIEKDVYVNSFSHLVENRTGLFVFKE